MKTNADLTVYHKTVAAATRTEVWTRSQISGVLWEERKAANVLRSGLLEADRVAIYVPVKSVPGGTLGIGIEDVLVRGLVTDEVTSSFTITDLKAKYPRSATVRSVDFLDFGSARMHHWQIGAS